MNGLCDVCESPATVGNFCTACLAVFKNNLTQIPWLLQDLEVTITKQAKQTVPGPGGGERSLPLNLGASDAADELRAVLRGVAIRTRVELRGDPSTPGGVSSLVLRVTRHMEDIARRVDGPDWAHRTAEAVNRAGRVIDTPVERFTYGKCDCGATITAPADRDTTVCPVCRVEHDVREWRERKESEALGRVPDFTGTMNDVLMVLGLAGVKVKRGTADRWVYDGKLRPIEEGGRVFKAADVLSVAGMSLTS